MKASPATRSWVAAGIRHELLTRALPALRHDMAGPVSVIRMSILLLKRQVATTAEETALWDERFALIEEQVTELANGVRSLRDWELAVSDDGITRSALVAQGVTLMRAAFELQGIRLEVSDRLASADDEPRFPSGAALRYLFLGALGYLHDVEAQTAAIRIEPDGLDALRFTAMPGDEPEAADPLAQAHRAPRALAIDAVALQSLADGLGYAVVVAPGTVRCQLAPA